MVTAYVARLVVDRRRREAASASGEIAIAHGHVPGVPVRIRVVQVDRLPQPLTCREMEILTLMAQGVTNQEIGAHCGIASSTTQRYTRNILRKLGAKRRIEALRRAHSLGLIHSCIY